MMEWGSGRAGEPTSEEQEEESRAGAGPAGPEAPSDEQAKDRRETADPAADEELDGAEGDTDEEGERPRSPGVPIPTWLLVLIIIAGILITYSAVRIAGEQRYQSCVQAVSARLGSATDSLSRLVRDASVKRCSHSPF
jgi:hypothetical protein